MKERLRGLAADVNQQTPGQRERYVDFLRALVVVVVVLGHWLAAVITVNDQGGLQPTNIIAVAPWTQTLTWIIQVLPIFFLVGGYANAVSWTRTAERGGQWTNWLYARMRRLLRPASVFLAVIVTAAAVARLAGADPDLVRPVAFVAGFLLWFLAVYIPVVALTPLGVRAHELWGLGTVVAMTAAVALVDLARLAFDVPGVGWLNFLLVYAAAAQLGIAWRAGRFSELTVPAAMLAVGLLMAIALVASPAYPLSMVTVPGAGDSNASPPSLAFLMLGIAQAGLVLLLRERGRQWCERPAVWLGAVLINRRIMTIYLWQMVPLIAGVGLLVATGLFPSPEPASAAWWALRPLWVAALLLLFVPVVALAGMVEARTGPPEGMPAARHAPLRMALAVAGVALLSFGLARLVLGGMSTGGAPAGIPVIPLAAYLAGAAAVWAAPAR